MRALLWKDFRLNRLTLAVTLSLWLGPFLILALKALYDSWPSWPAGDVWAEHLQLAAYTGLILTQLSLAILGGNAIACERADRSAEFLACLPPPRGMVLTSKALLAVGAPTFCWTVNLAVILLLAPALAGYPLPPPYPMSLPHLAASSLFLFGAGWLGSSFLESAAFATCIGLGLPILSGVLLVVSSTFLGWPMRGQLGTWLPVLNLVLGSTSFLGGTIYLLRRAEP